MLGGAESRSVAGDIRQMVRRNVVNRLTELGSVPGLFQNLRPYIGEAQTACGAFDQADAKLRFELGNTPADRGGRHLEYVALLRRSCWPELLQRK